MKNPEFNQHETFCRFVQEKTDDPDLGRFILSWLQLPPNLSYLCDGLWRTASIVRYRINDVEAHARGVHRPRSLATQLEKIAASENELSSLLGPDVLKKMGRVGDKDPHPYNKYSLSISHYWAGLFYTRDSKEGTDLDYEELFSEFAIFLWAVTAKFDPEVYEVWIRQWMDTGKMPPQRNEYTSIYSRLSKAAYAMRLLTLPPYSPLFFSLANKAQGADLPTRVYNALELGEHYWETVNDTPRTHLWERLNDIALLLCLAIPGWVRPGETAPRQLRSSRRGKFRRPSEGDGYVRLAGTDWVIESVTTDDDTSLDIYQLCTDGPETIDDDPVMDDYVEKSEILGVAESGETNPPSLSVRSVRASAQLQQLARHYLQMPNTYALPSDQDLQRILDSLRDVQATVDVPHLLIAATIILGRPLEEVSKLRFSDQSEHPMGNIEYLLDTRCWRLKVTGPDLVVSENIEQEETIEYHNAIPVSEYMLLPDCIDFWRMLAQLKTPFSVGDILVPTFAKRLKKATAAKLQAFTGEQRIGVSALGKRMFRELITASNGDLAPATLITGQSHAHARTTLHYSCYEERYLIDIYIRAAESTIGECWTSEILLESPARYFGNPTHPKKSALIDLIGRYAKLLDKTDPHKNLFAYHDHYTVYTVILLTLAQARRPVISPSFHALEPHSLAGTWTEKARNEAQRRAGFLPPTLTKQLTAYIAHLRAMCGYSDEFRAFIQDGHRFLVTDSDVGMSSRLRPFRPKDFRIANIVNFGLPLYSLRRFTRMALLVELDVSGEEVDAVMGHTRAGLSPFESLSTFPATKLQALADGPIEQMLTSLSAKSINSKLVAYA